MTLSRCLPGLLALALSAAACTPGVAPRSGRVLAPGGFAAEFRATPVAGTLGQVELTTRLDDTSTVDGNTTASFQIPWLALGGFWFWFEYTFRLGLFDPCELGLDYGVMQMGGELRCALLDDRRGDPVSLAVGAGGTWFPAHHEQGWAARLGVDLGLPLSPAWQLVGGLWGHVGARRHILRLDGDDVDDKFLADSEDFFAVPPHAAVERLEMRLAGHLGFTVEDEDDDEGVGGTFAVIGWVIPWADEALLHGLCDGCSALDVTDLVEDWGVALSLTLTATMLPPEHLSLVELESQFPAPDGHHYERRLDDDLAVGAWVLLGTSYGVGAVPAIMFALMDIGDEGDQAIASATWFVPIAGPIVWRQYLDADSALENAFFDVIGYGTSLMQLTSALLLWQAWVHGDHWLVPDDDTLGIAPMPLADGIGLTVGSRL